MTGPHDIDRQLLDAVENLVPLWFSAVGDVSPRLSPRQILALRAVRGQPELNLTALAEQLAVGLPTASRSATGSKRRACSAGASVSTTGARCT
ncbi:hypothetical protein [Streptomyces stelliscabiei]|uniref:hypothetical protein n=1 Tax=Streptomyces stelliscabiei TaxID=146820 RepID=UPI002FF09907